MLPSLFAAAALAAVLGDGGFPVGVPLGVVLPGVAILWVFTLIGITGY